MGIFSRDPAVSLERHPDPVPLSRATVLGSHLGSEYVRLDGREYALRGSAESPLDLSPAPGEVVLSRPRYIEDAGRRLEMGKSYSIGAPVEAGTFERLAAPKKGRAKAPRPVDALGALPLLRGRQASFVMDAPRARDLVPLAGERDPDLSTIHELQPKPHVAQTPARSAASGVEDIIGRLSAKGVTLALTPRGGLIATAPNGRMTDELRHVVDKAGDLMRAHLAGQPLRCELEHKDQAPVASTLAVGAPPVPACAQHMSGELEP